MKFDHDFIEKVREASDLVQEISQYSELKGKGTEYIGLCPFPDHNERSPSFSVSSTKQVYHCFGCKKSGNVFTFVQMLKGLNFPETIEYLAKKAGIAIPEKSFSSKQNFAQQKKTRLDLSKVNASAAQFFLQQLKRLTPQSEVKQYLQQRGLTTELVEIFKIGYASEGWHDLMDHFVKRGVSTQILESLGLAKKSQSQQKYFDVFRGRLMFPIYNHKGECVGFGGRILGEGQPKYYNSPETPIFNKGKIFYGLYETSKYIRTEDFVIVVEGYMDLIAMYKAGFKNVVATLGTALTSHHAKLIKRFTKNVLVLFDGDEAGQSAMEKSLPLLLHEGLYPKGLVLREGLDPDDFIKKYGAKELKKEIQAAPDLFNVVFQKKLAHFHGGAAEKVTVLDKMSPYLAEISDPRLKELYTYEVAEALTVQPDWVKRGVQHFLKGQQRQKVGPSDPNPPPASLEKPKDSQGLEKIHVSNPNKSELYLLNIALMRQDLLEKVEESEILEQFSHTSLKKIFGKAIEFYRQMPNKFDNLTALLATFVTPESVLGLQLLPELNQASPEKIDKLYKDCLRKIKEAYIKDQSKKMAQQLKLKPVHEQEEELKRLMELQKDKMLLRLDKDNNP